MGGKGEDWSKWNEQIMGYAEAVHLGLYHALKAVAELKIPVEEKESKEIGLLDVEWKRRFEIHRRLKREFAVVSPG